FDCSLQESFEGQTLTFYFSGVPIVVDLSTTMFEIATVNGQAICTPAFTSSDTSDGEMSLGDSFLRSAYVVYHLGNFEISLGQADYTTDSNIQSIGATVPGAKPASQYDGPSEPACSTASSSSTSAHSSQSSTAQSSRSSATQSSRSSIAQSSHSTTAQ